MTDITEYTPILDEVRLAYVDRKDFEDQLSGAERRTDEAANAEFHRFVASVRADQIEKDAQIVSAMENGWVDHYRGSIVNKLDAMTAIRAQLGGQS